MIPPTDHFHPQTSPLFPNSSSSALPLQAMIPCHHNQQLPDQSWSQLLLGGFMEEEMMLYLSSQSSHMVDHVKNIELLADHHKGHDDDHAVYGGQGIYINHEEIQDQYSARSSNWISHQIMLQNSSPTSCVMLKFSDHNKAQSSHHQLDHYSSLCNSTPTGSAWKKPRATAQSPFKVRKEKLGDRITALHQIVSPFGKTDTASVLLEAIGYIRFLQSQIEALSCPYLGSTGTGGNIKQSAGKGDGSCIFPEDPGQLLNDNCVKRLRGPPDQDGVDESKDLRSRGLCLVPVAFFTMHVGNDNAADYWVPAFGGAGVPIGIDPSHLGGSRYN